MEDAIIYDDYLVTLKDKRLNQSKKTWREVMPIELPTELQGCTFSWEESPEYVAWRDGEAARSKRTKGNAQAERPPRWQPSETAS